MGLFHNPESPGSHMPVSTSVLTASVTDAGVPSYLSLWGHGKRGCLSPNGPGSSKQPSHEHEVKHTEEDRARSTAEVQPSPTQMGLKPALLQDSLVSSRTPHPLCSR